MSTSIRESAEDIARHAKDLAAAAVAFPDATMLGDRLYRTNTAIAKPTEIVFAGEDKLASVAVCVGEACWIIESNWSDYTGERLVRELLRRRPDLLAEMVEIVRGK